MNRLRGPKKRFDGEGCAAKETRHSGTGELSGPHGEAKIANEPDSGHAFTLDYEIEKLCGSVAPKEAFNRFPHEEPLHLS